MTEKHEEPESTRDDIATLVRLAGRRQEVPHDRTERVRAAARAEWQDSVRKRSRRRTSSALWAVGALATAALLVLAVALRFLPAGPGTAETSQPMLVESLSGAAFRVVDGDPERYPIAVGDALANDSTVHTSPSGGAAVRLASGHSVRLDAGTILRVSGHGASLELERGTVYVDSGLESVAPSSSRASRSSLEVRTPFSVIEEIGTQFEVQLKKESVRVRLREGEVIVHRADGEHRMQAGTELEMLGDGSVTRRAVPPHGPDWSWIADLTPMLELEGRSARVFLDWVARERGLTLAFADESVARSASEIVLGGTGAGLKLDEALDAVLPSCRLTYRINGHVLLIDAERR